MSEIKFLYFYCLLHLLVRLRFCFVFEGLQSARSTGSRGDVFVKTRPKHEIMGYFDRVDDRVTVSLHILYTPNQVPRSAFA